MYQEPDVNDVAGALQVSLGLLRRRLRQAQAEGQLTLPETSALARLDRGGPATPSALAKLEQISPQSMGATLGALEAGGLVERRPDPGDGRRAVMSLTKAWRRRCGTGAARGPNSWRRPSRPGSRARNSSS